MWMIYKESAYGFTTELTTPFEHWSIMLGGVGGHNMYNQARTSFDIRGCEQEGYYRQTDPEGKCLGYNLVNNTGFKDQFNPPDDVEITHDADKPLFKEIIELLKF